MVEDAPTAVVDEVFNILTEKSLYPVDVFVESGNVIEESAGVVVAITVVLVVVVAIYILFPGSIPYAPEPPFIEVIVSFEQVNAPVEDTETRCCPAEHVVVAMSE